MTPAERAEMREHGFKFLQPVRNTVAGEKNPHRDGWYLRSFHRSGRLNPGTWAVVLHDDGEESNTPLANLIPLEQSSILDALDAADTLAQQQATRIAALEGAIETECGKCQESAPPCNEVCWFYPFQKGA